MSSERRTRSPLIDGILELLRHRLTDSRFWWIQIQVFAITAAHYTAEHVAEHGSFLHLNHALVALFVVPVIYAGMRFGIEGGALTGAWAVLLTLPAITLSHDRGMEWAVEFVQVGTALTVGLVVAVLVEHEAAARRRAEALAARVGRMNRLILHAQEDERRRIARDLHDDSVQKLIVLCHQLDEAARARASEEGRAYLQEARHGAETLLGDLRGFARELRPSVLDDLGLPATLEWLCASRNASNDLDVRLEVGGEPRRLSPPEELALFRIAQEALRNVERHAGATSATVRLDFGSGATELEVSDDGRGLQRFWSMNELVARGNLGIAGMRERAELVGARLEIGPRPGGGTRVWLSLPAARVPRRNIAHLPLGRPGRATGGALQA